MGIDKGEIAAERPERCCVRRGLRLRGGLRVRALGGGADAEGNMAALIGKG